MWRACPNFKVGQGARCHIGRRGEIALRHPKHRSGATTLFGCYRHIYRNTTAYPLTNGTPAATTAIPAALAPPAFGAPSGDDSELLKAYADFIAFDHWFYFDPARHEHSEEQRDRYFRQWCDLKDRISEFTPTTLAGFAAQTLMLARWALDAIGDYESLADRHARRRPRCFDYHIEIKLLWCVCDHAWWTLGREPGGDL
jgi:hypothetical protein